MDSNKSKVRLYNDGLIANNIHLVLKKWLIDKDYIKTILSDKTTMFATMNEMVKTKNSMECRKLLGVRDNMDVAVIFTVIMSRKSIRTNDMMTIWIVSDLQESSFKIFIRGKLNKSLEEADVGTVCAMLNPDIMEHVAGQDLRSLYVTHMDDILVIGHLDGLNLCKGVTKEGTMCKNLVYVHNQGEFCRYHLSYPKREAKANNTSKMKTSKNPLNISTRLNISNSQETKPYTFVEPSKPTNMADTINKLGELNTLIQKVKNSRNPKPPGDITPTTITKTKRNKEDLEAMKEFEKLANLVKEYLNNDPKDYNKLLGTLQLMVRKLNGVPNDLVGRTQILKACDQLLEHPVENIAISALKLKRTLKKHLKGQRREIPELNSQEMKTEVENVNSEKTTMSESNKKQVLENLDTLIGLTSKVDFAVDKEEGEKLLKKLKNIENLDKNDQFKKTITYIKVDAYYCEECDHWYQRVSDLCTKEGHKLTFKRVKKEWFFCINKRCRCAFYAINSKKPSRCPKCRESTVVSEKTSAYMTRTDYKLPNEILLDCEPGAFRPETCDS